MEYYAAIKNRREIDVECSPGEIVWKRQGLQQSPQLNN
jgi:hypothetical protein